MALRKPNDQAETTETATAEKPTVNTAAFEPMDEAPDADAANDAAAETASETRAVTPVKSQPLVAKPTGGNLSAGTVLKGLQNSIPLEDLEAMGFGTFPRITAGQQSIMLNKTEKDLGSRVEVEVFSWNYLWLITTGEQNNAEANKLIKSSYDGTNLVGGGTVDEYLKLLKESEGYNKAGVKQYIEMYVHVLRYWEANPKNRADVKEVVVEPGDRELHQVSLAPTSVSQWNGYLINTALRKKLGKEDSNVVTLVINPRERDGNAFGVIKFEPNFK